MTDDIKETGLLGEDVFDCSTWGRISSNTDNTTDEKEEEVYGSWMEDIEDASTICNRLRRGNSKRQPNKLTQEVCGSDHSKPITTGVAREVREVI